MIVGFDITASNMQHKKKDITEEEYTEMTKYFMDKIDIKVIDEDDTSIDIVFNKDPEENLWKLNPGNGNCMMTQADKKVETVSLYDSDNTLISPLTFVDRISRKIIGEDDIDEDSTKLSWETSDLIWSLR